MQTSGWGIGNKTRGGFGGWLWPLVAIAGLLAGAAWLLFKSDALVDCMGYYHLAVARLYAEHGIVRQFPAIPFSELNAQFVDQHFLYNLLIVPFVWLFGDGMFTIHLVTLLWIAALLIGVALFARRFKLPAAAWLVLLMAVGILLFSARMVMPRPMIASAVFLLAFHGAMYARRYWWLLVIAFFYGWLYHASVQVLASALLWVGVVYVTERRLVDRLFIFPLFGLVAAMVINPHTPHSLSFFIRHTFFMSHGAEGVALPAEWLPMALSHAFSELAFVLVLLGLLVLPYLLTRRRPSAAALHALVMVSLYFVGILKAQRFFEYIGVFVVMAVGFLLKDMPEPRRWLRPLMVSVLAITVIAAAWVNVPRLLAFRDSARFDPARMAGVADYLKAHAKPGETIFNAYSGDFPELLYHAPDFGYTEGHNHTLMAYFDSKRYKDFMTIVLKPGPDAPQLVRDRFGARYVVISALTVPLVPGLMDAISNGRGFELVYGDKHALVARIKPDSKE